MPELTQLTNRGAGIHTQVCLTGGGVGGLSA